MKPIRPIDLALIVTITLIGLAARAYKLDSPLWYDEILTLTDYVRLPALDIVTTYGSLNNHIFYSLQAHAAVALFGESAWALRLPAVLFGVATVPLLWLLVLRIGAPVAMAHISALLLALNYHHIWFSQNARGYTGLVFWSLIALLLLIEARRSSRPTLWLALSLAGAFAMYTHLSGAFFLAGLFLAFVTVEVLSPQDASVARRFGMPVLAFFGMGLIALILHAPVLAEILQSVNEVAESGGSNSQPDPLANWKNPVTSLLSALGYLPLPLPITLVALPFLLAGATLALVRIGRWDSLFAAVVPLSIGATLTLLMLAGMRIWPRFFLVDVVLLLVVATVGVAVVAGLVARGSAARLLTLIGWTAGIAVSAVWGAQNYRAPKQDLAGAIAYVTREAAPEDLRASFGLAARPLSTYLAPDWEVVADSADLTQLVAQPGRLWMVYAFEDHSRGHYPDLFALLDRDFEIATRRSGTLGGGTVFVLHEK